MSTGRIIDIYLGRVAFTLYLVVNLLCSGGEMDVMGSSPVRSLNVSWGFSMALRWAFLEWLLMFMLFIEATFSYLVTKFARHYKLQIPCLLCSRLDHVMCKQRSGFYWDLVCGKHKSEISSLVHCHIQNKLVYVHGTCNKEWISRGYAHNILHSTSIGSLADELEEPLSTTIEQNKSINSKENFTVQHEQLIDDDLTSERLIHQDSATEPSVLDPTVLEVICNPHGRTENAAAIGHGLEELNWKQIENRANTSELISFDEQVSREMCEFFFFFFSKFFCSSLLFYLGFYELPATKWKSQFFLILSPSQIDGPTFTSVLFKEALISN